MGRLLLFCLFSLVALAQPVAQVRLPDAADRAAFQLWFAYLADAQFYRTTPEVQDCAGLVRHAVREALRPHTPEWIRTATLPVLRTYPDVRERPPLAGTGLALFRVTAGSNPRHSEFADAKTIVRLNARLIGRDLDAARPGDLLYFHQPAQPTPDHLMVFVGPSAFEPQGQDWVVYHTGPVERDGPRDASNSRPVAQPPSRPAHSPNRPTAHPPGPGEVRKVRLSDLARHPSPRWRPTRANPAFIGLYRLNWL